MGPGSYDKRKVEILIVEDSATQRERLKHLLEERGFTVTSAVNGREAIEAARRRQPTIIISDIVMPELDGYGLCKALRSDEMLKEIPVMLLTSLSEPHDVIFGLECGADNFIRKPYQADYLLHRIDYLLMNLELRRCQKMRMGIEITLDGQRHFITSERQQILDLLISTYEQATQINRELAEREGELAHSVQVLNGLYHIAEGLNKASNEAEVTETALERAVSLPGIQAGWISLREGASGFRQAATRNLPPALQIPGAMDGTCYCRRKLLAGELETVVNVQECERLAKATGDTQGMRYHAVVPLSIGDRILGMMSLVGPREGLFTEPELKILYGVGTQIAVALERAQLHAHLERMVVQRTAALSAEVDERRRAEARVRRLNRVYAFLSGINTTIVRATERQALFDEACRIAVQQGGFRMAWIGLLDAKGLDVNPIARAGLDDGYLDRIRLTAREGEPDSCLLLSEALKQDHVVICNDIGTDMRMARWREAALQQGFRSVVVLPLHQDMQLVGVLLLYAPEQDFFDDEEMKLLTEVAGDISFAVDHIEKTARIDYLAYYDAVTNLPNRTLLLDRLAERLRGASQEGRMLAVCILDVDRFKSINDAMGKSAGDLLLRQIAERLSVALGNDKELARTGADTFAVMLRDVESGNEAARRIEHLKSACFGGPFMLEGREVRVSGRAGVALFPTDATESERLFANAEVAWKKAKQGGDACLFYTEGMTEAVAQSFSLENQLRRALEKGEFVLHYQPKVDTETRHITGVEALIRWQSPDLGLVPPLQFIPLLEETGLIQEVGAWALGQAVADYREWLDRELAAPRIAVNISAIQLRQADFVGMVTRAINGKGPVPAIDLELTESLLMADMPGTIEKLNALRKLGLKVAIDDFGTGHSSLRYLAKLPVDTIKIDRSFISMMLEDPATMTLVQVVISLGHSLRMSVVAEGVDSEELAHMLRLLRCDQMQGYLFSKPLPMHEMTALLAKA